MTHKTTDSPSTMWVWGVISAATKVTTGLLLPVWCQRECTYRPIILNVSFYWKIKMRKRLTAWTKFDHLTRFCRGNTAQLWLTISYYLIFMCFSIIMSCRAVLKNSTNFAISFLARNNIVRVTDINLNLSECSPMIENQSDRCSQRSDVISVL